MVIGIEERQAISRRNGAKSKGATSHAGKIKCSRNSIKHGFYAVVHNLPDEDPVEVGALRDRWFSDVGPRNVAEEFLTLQCFRAHLQGNRVERARHARLTQQMDKATAPWHDRRDAAVSELWNGLVGCSDARDILDQLRQTTMGLRSLADEWVRLRAGLEELGYWPETEITAVVCLSGCPTYAEMLLEDEDAYRLHLWNYRCEPEPDWALIEGMIAPTSRPPGLRNVDRDVLLPTPAECLARLKQWADDEIAELNQEWERVWREVEAPELARRTDPQTLVRDTYEEARLHRATNEYQALFYKAHNALEAIRKREAAEAREARKNADRNDSRESAENEGLAGCHRQNGSDGTAVVAAQAPAAAPVVVESPVTPCEIQPAVDPACIIEVKATADAGARNEPGAGARNEPDAGARNEPDAVTEDCEAGVRNQPGTATENLYGMSVTAVPTELAMTAEAPRMGPPEPSDRPCTPQGIRETRAERKARKRRDREGRAEPSGKSYPGAAFVPGRPSAGISRGDAGDPRYIRAPGSGDDWSRPPTVTQACGGPAVCNPPWPHLADPEIPWERLSTQERSAIDTLDRQALAEFKPRL